MRIKKSTLKTFGIILAFVLIVGALIGLFAFFDKKADEKTTTIHSTYAVGGLTEQGQYMDTTESLYTKNLIDCMGLKTEIVFDNNISYKIYFYDVDNNFISSTSALRENFDSSNSLMPIGTRKCRIVITPNDDENVKWYELRNYSKQLSIKVNKNQKKIDGVEVPVNVFAIDSSMVGKYYNYNTGEPTTSNTYNTTTKVAVGNKTKLKIDFPDVSSVRQSGSFLVYYFDSTGSEIIGHETLSSANYFTGCSEIFELPSDTCYVAMACYANCESPAMYLI